MSSEEEEDVNLETRQSKAASCEEYRIFMVNLDMFCGMGLYSLKMPVNASFWGTLFSMRKDENFISIEIQKLATQLVLSVVLR